MSWNYSRELAAAYWEACFADTDACAPSKLIPTADLFLCSGKKTDTSRFSRFGMTCGHLTEHDGAALLTWYLEAFLAKTYPPPETELVSPERSRPSGLRCSASFGRYDRSTSLWKTPPDLFGMDSTLSSAAWTKAGTMRNGVCWERPMSAHPIIENDAGFWHTPTVVQCSRSEEAWEKRKKKRHAAGRKTIPPGSLEEQVLMSGETPCWDWNSSPANPRSESTRQMFPTPTTGGLNGGSNSRAATKKRGMWRTPIASQGRQDGIMKPLASKPSPKTGRKDRQIKLSDQIGGKLNPEWVELLMNFPVGWTETTHGWETGNKESLELLEVAKTDCFASKDSAMLKSRSAPQPHGEFCTSESMEEQHHEH